MRATTRDDIDRPFFGLEGSNPERLAGFAGIAFIALTVAAEAIASKPNESTRQLRTTRRGA